MSNTLTFTDKKIVILGLARQGVALMRFFIEQGAQVTISDLATPDALAADVAALNGLPLEFALGGHPLALLDNCDLLCLSGGVPPQVDIVQQAIKRGIRLSNDSLLTLQLARERGLGPIIAITGSSGKTTTTTLVGEMLTQSATFANHTVHVGGNIGTPLIDHLADVQPGDPIVMELSSFQLELFDPALAWGTLNGIGPDIAAILNITPNHLDRHPDMAAYTNAKLNLLRHLPADATVVLSADDGVTSQAAGGRWQVADGGAPTEWGLEKVLSVLTTQPATCNLQPVFFSREQTLTSGAWLASDLLLYDGETICERADVKLRGDHNISNLLAAAAISGAGMKKSGRADISAMGKVAGTFAGVPHRLEVVAEVNGITWINDSIATSPERALAALRSFDVAEQTLILLAGGKDKNLPWEAFVDEILARVDYLIGFGQAGPMIVEMAQERAQLSEGYAPNSAVVQRLDEATDLAARAADANTVILLAPGGTSYDAYRDFEARGEHFRQLVQVQVAKQAAEPMMG